MDHQTPPITALENLSITMKPTPQESYKRAYLNALLDQWYKSSSPSTRMLHSRFRTKKTGNVVEYNVVGERIIRLLCNMAEDKPECRDELELAISYVKRRQNQEQVVSIVKSLY